MSQSPSKKTEGQSARPRAAAGTRSRLSGAHARQPGAARDALLQAALAEFGEVGFDGTDTNRIARRAGYAPQTFYRHFTDKAAIFIEAYRLWVEAEWRDLEKARGKGADQTARIVLRHHAAHREFRRSLRRLSTMDPRVRAARTESRTRQLQLLDAQTIQLGRRRSPEATVGMLLAVERIADAAADGELADLGLSRRAQEELLAEVIRRLGKLD